uniref:Uncharacterized protein n=1 Tax=Parascaris equorum TaxID=6256 RepID=A0A914R4C4_PAREQ
MLTREEVLASWKPQKYLKEKKDAEEAEERARQQDAIKIKRHNEQLLQKYPNLPPLLLFNVPEEGVPRMFPNSFPLLPTDDGYVPEWNRMMMQYSWTEKYVACRRAGVDVSKDVHIDADNYLSNLTLGELLSWSDWENRMRTMDNFPAEILRKNRIKNPFLPVMESNSSLSDMEISALRPCNGETLRERIVKAPAVRLKMQVALLRSSPY